MLAEIIDYLRDMAESSNNISVFKLSSIKKLFCDRLVAYGATAESVKNVHSTRLKNDILHHIPELEEEKQGNNVLLTPKEETGTAIYQACLENDQDDGICLSKAANIIRKHVFSHKIEDPAQFLASQKASVPPSLVTFISMLIIGTCITDSLPTSAHKASLTIAQLVKFNMVKGKRSNTTNEIARHSKEQETPFPLYLGLMIHSKTRKKGLVGRLAKYGMCVSYDRVQHVQTSIAKEVCQQYQQQGIVSPPCLKEGLFTTAAIDNIDHNPSSVTAANSFHGTSISIFQHPDSEIQMHLPGLRENDQSSNVELKLPESYTSLPSTKSFAAEFPLQSVNPNSVLTKQATDESLEWLSNSKSLNEGNSTFDIKNRLSWSGFHAHRVRDTPVRSLSTLLPLLKDSVNSSAMVRHTMDIIKSILLGLNSNQAPVITADQPVYALGKQVQWMYPAIYGEDNLLMMLGTLHIEMAFLDAIGDWLEGSGWTEILVKAQINSPGRAESFLSGRQVKRARYTHQVSCAGLYLLLQMAHLRSNSGHSLESWTSKRLEESVQFKYWHKVIELESILLLLIYSVRVSNFDMFVSALEQIAPSMFSLDHTHYARWLPIFINDLKQLKEKHPRIYEEFKKGHFTSKKTKRKFSSMPEDQAHENKTVKIDGGAIGILDNATALIKWMIAGPEIARLLELFEDATEKEDKNLSHHEDTDAHEKRFRQDVISFKNIFEELGNPFEENDILLNSVSRNIMNERAAESVRLASVIGENQYQQYVSENCPFWQVPIENDVYSSATIR